jgi:hypothetical protein
MDRSIQVCRTATRLAVPVLLALAAACAGRSMPAYEFQSYPALAEGQLTKETIGSKEAFIETLSSNGATNIISAEGYVSGKGVSAVTADFLDYIYLFRDGGYVGRVSISYDEGYPQVHPFVKIVEGKNLFGVFLVADNIRLGGKRVAQLILVGKGGKVTTRALSLDGIIEVNGGLYDPYVGGDSLSTGIVLCARDGGGKAWDVVYHLTLEEAGLRAAPKPVNFAYGCSCFTDWLGGRDGREVFGMMVKRGGS